MFRNRTVLKVAFMLLLLAVFCDIPEAGRHRKSRHHDEDYDEDYDSDYDDDEDYHQRDGHRGNSSDRETLREVSAIRQWVSARRAQFDPQDVDHLLNGPEWHVTRYIKWLGHGKLEEIFNLLAENLKWRKSIGINAMRPEHFPCEFWLAGFAHLTVDRNGGPAVGSDAKVSGLFSGGLHDAWWDMMYFIFNMVDQKAGQDGTHWILVQTLKGAGLQTVADVKGLSRFFPLADRFAGQFVGYYIYDLHPVVETAARMLTAMTAPRMRDTMHFLGDKERFFYVKKRDLPEFLGGRLPPVKSLAAVHFPRSLLDKDCIPLRRMARARGWSEQSVREFLTYTAPYIEANMRILNFTR